MKDSMLAESQHDRSFVRLNYIPLVTTKTGDCCDWILGVNGLL